MPCPQYENLITNTPLMVKGSDVYDKCQTVKRICMIMAYNNLPDTKPKLRYEPLMKPLDKEGKNKGKFYPLTTSDLKLCMDESEAYLDAIRTIELAHEHKERQRLQSYNETRDHAAEESDHHKEVELEDKAISFLKDKPMDKIRDQYFRLHKGDEDALRTVIWSYCYKWIDIAPDEGLHIIAIGTRGTGKSHGIVSAMKFLPQELTISAGISARSLYYKKDIPRGATIYLDELPSDQNLIESLKTIITYYPEGGKRIVTYNQDTLELSTPARLTINTSTVDQTADEQFTNRMCVIRADDDKDAKKDRIDFRIKLYSGIVEKLDPDALEEIQTALRYISQKTFRVTFPPGAIECDDYVKIDMRVFNQFCGAVIGNTILNFPNRNPKETNGDTIEITVVKEDFDTVIYMYQDPNEYYLKLTPSAVLIKNFLESIYPQYRSIGDISGAVSLSTQTIRNTILGRKDRNIESLIGAGYIEEVGYSEREGEKGPSLTSKVYRATHASQKLDGEKPKKAKRDASSQAALSEIVGMLRWNQNAVLEYEKAINDKTKQTTTNQPLVC